MMETTELKEHLIDTCLDCYEACNSCAMDCNDFPELRECMNLCNDCASMCFQSAQDWYSNSHRLMHSIRTCIKMCEDCAAECEKRDHDFCKTCAETCRECARELYQIVIQ